MHKKEQAYTMCCRPEPSGNLAKTCKTDIHLGPWTSGHFSQSMPSAASCGRLAIVYTGVGLGLVYLDDTEQKLKLTRLEASLRTT